MKDVMASVSTYKRTEDKNIELYQECGSIRIQAYKRCNTYKEQILIYMEPGKNFEVSGEEWNCGYFMVKHREEVIDATRKAILRHMLGERTNKIYNPKAAVDHIQVINNYTIIFDSMRDAPGFWKLPKETITSIVNGINFDMENKHGGYLLKQDGKYYTAFRKDNTVKYYKDFKWIVVENENDEIMEIA
ncbi:MAG: hypothetical protein UIM53_02810 [Acutalibacteraceae bacterium]|nr:hypothetical protein [Acutalibacteraceae bacterium]